MVKNGEDFVVYDAKTGEDITRSVLTQIIFEQENKEGQNLLPITFLRQLIRFYGDSMQSWCRAISKSRSNRSPASRRSSASRWRRRSARRRSALDRGAGAPQHGDVRAAFAMFTPFARREEQTADDRRRAGTPAASRPATSTTEAPARRDAEAARPAAANKDESSGVSAWNLRG